MTGIVVEGLSKTYKKGKVKALDGVSLEIRPGEVFGVIGPNGAGKTTLMGCLLGLLHPDSGSVMVDGRSPNNMATHAITGYLPERLMFDRWMTGRGFLEYHHALALQPGADRPSAVTAALESVELEPADAAKKIKTYSRGMLQRLGFAQAVIGNPRYLFLDEPTSGMDPVGALLVRRSVARLRGEGVTIIINSHQLEQVERMCDRVAFVRSGRVESVLVAQAGAAVAHGLVIRVAGPAPEARVWRAAADATGAQLDAVDGGTARVFVASEDGAAALVAALVAAGVRVSQVIPEASRLERLFLDPGGPKT